MAMTKARLLKHDFPVHGPNWTIFDGPLGPFWLEEVHFGRRYSGLS